MHSRSLGRNSAVTSTSPDQAPGERCYGVVRFCPGLWYGFSQILTGRRPQPLVANELLHLLLPLLYWPHSFRVTTITDLLEQNVPREDVQHLAGHADPRTTNLYDRRKRKIKRNVDKISV